MCQDKNNFTLLNFSLMARLCSAEKPFWLCCCLAHSYLCYTELLIWTHTHVRRPGFISRLMKSVETILVNWYLTHILTGICLTVTYLYWLIMKKSQLYSIRQCISRVDKQARWSGVPKNTVQMNILAVIRLFPHTPLCISTWTQLTGAPDTMVHYFTGVSLVKAQMWHP